MPRPTSAQLDKARNACLEAAQALTKHPEYDRFNRFIPDQDVETNDAVPSYTTVMAHLRFVKNGREIFHNPLSEQDYDFPELVGHHVLEQELNTAAASAGLKVSGDTRLFISPNEKGSVTVGYRFHHPQG